MRSEGTKGFTQIQITGLVAFALAASLAFALGAQYLTEQDRMKLRPQISGSTRDIYEISKLDAEISRIRSETAGSRFALSLIALFVTVGGAVGGYLIGQSSATQARIEFDDRRNVDNVYQIIVQELSADSSILRAAAAVKLGSILKSFPAEWHVKSPRKKQLIELTKQVLAAALAIEDDKTVLKTLSISLRQHENDSSDAKYNLREVNFSGARAHNAYWADCDFSNSDFFMADLEKASFRRSILSYAQFRETKLAEAIFNDADCSDANFDLADLRGASFANAILRRTSFSGAKVYAVVIRNARIEAPPNGLVDLSEHGDGSMMKPVSEWLSSSKEPD